MKKVFILVSCALMTLSVCVAKNTYTNLVSTSVVSLDNQSETNVPMGLFKNGNNWIKVNKGWLRIVINGSMKEYDYSVEKDPWGNYILKFNGTSATLASDGKSIYYNGTTYRK